MPSRIVTQEAKSPRPADAPSETSAGGVIRLVHGAREHSAQTGTDVPHFPGRLRAQRPISLFAHAAREVATLKSAISEALAQSESTIESGRIPELRRMLQRLRGEAEGVARLVDRLQAVAEPAAGERRVLSLDDAIDRALEALPSTTAVVRTGPPDLPPVTGHPQGLTQMILMLLAGSTDAGTITIATSAREGALVGERIVSMRIVGARPAVETCERELQAAMAIARDHGGFVRVDHLGHARAVTVELPAL